MLDSTNTPIRPLEIEQLFGSWRSIAMLRVIPHSCIVHLKFKDRHNGLAWSTRG